MYPRLVMAASALLLCSGTASFALTAHELKLVSCVSLEPDIKPAARLQACNELLNNVGWSAELVEGRALAYLDMGEYQAAEKDYRSGLASSKPLRPTLA